MIKLDIRNDGRGDTPIQVIQRIQNGALLKQAEEPATRPEVEQWHAACLYNAAPFHLPSSPNQWSPKDRNDWARAAAQINGVLAHTSLPHLARLQAASR